MLHCRWQVTLYTLRFSVFTSVQSRFSSFIFGCFYLKCAEICWYIEKCPFLVFLGVTDGNFMEKYSVTPSWQRTWLPQMTAVRIVSCGSADFCVNERSIEVFPFFWLFLLQKAEICWHIWKISISRLLWSDRWKLHGEIQRHAIVITYMFMTNDRCEDSFV